MYINKWQWHNRVAVETLIHNLKLRGQIDLNRLDLLFFLICDIYRKDRTAGHLVQQII